MLPLVLGTTLAIGALAFVLYPLFASPQFGTPVSAPSKEAPPSAELEAVIALREIEFDRETGKLSDSDYAELKSRYTERALHAMRRLAPDDSSDDAIEAAVLEYRGRLKTCATCGTRPEPDALYCSNCGCYLPGACSSCAAPVSEAGAAFCSACGRQLAA
ncbi:MAG: zinc ribbon domain-containing protein [Gemmatimonadota bacterium]